MHLLEILLPRLRVSFAPSRGQDGLGPSRVLTLELAKRVAAAAEAEARRRAVAAAIAVVDARGHPLVLLRLDDAHVARVAMSLRKARVATSCGPLVVDRDPGLLPGGLPLTWEGEVLGAIGMSSAATRADEVIARAGVAELVV